MRELDRHTRWACALAAVVVFAAGCGGDDDEYANEARPPTPINVSAAITENRIVVSPDAFGAGPIMLIVTNQTDRARSVTFETDEIAGAAPGVKQTTSPINPDGTAALKLDLRTGQYRLTTQGGTRQGAPIEVGEPRTSAQDELLLP